jgi:glycosyltransferase involved in cell wall biosynthesis
VIVGVNALSVRPGVYDGAATFAVNLLLRLPEALPEARIVVFVRDGETRIPEGERLSVRPLRVPAGAAGRVVFESVGLARRLARERCDVVLSPNESLPLRLPCPAVVVAQNLVYHCPDSGFRGLRAADRAVSRVQRGYYRRRMRAAYGRAAAVVAVSEETRRVLAAHAGLDPARATVVHEGSDSVFLQELPRRPEGRLLAVSALAPYKNLELAIDAVAALGPPAALDVVGGDWRGFRSVLEARVAAAGVADRVRFLGGVGPERLAELYARATLLLHLSACESFGLPMLEAMRCGVPVVAAARSSAPEVAGGAARLVEPEAAGVAAAVRELVQDDAELERLTALGRRRAAELTWGRTAAGVAAVLRRGS